MNLSRERARSLQKSGGIKMILSDRDIKARLDLVVDPITDLAIDVRLGMSSRCINYHICRVSIRRQRKFDAVTMPG